MATYNIGAMEGRYWDIFRALSGQCSKEVDGYVDWAMTPEMLAQWLRDNGIDARYFSKQNRTYFSFDVDSPAVTMLLLRG